jgi:hypothetical protein
MNRSSFRAAMRKPRGMADRVWDKIAADMIRGRMDRLEGLKA